MTPEQVAKIARELHAVVERQKTEQQYALWIKPYNEGWYADTVSADREKLERLARAQVCYGAEGLTWAIRPLGMRP